MEDFLSKRGTRVEPSIQPSKVISPEKILGSSNIAGKAAQVDQNIGRGQQAAGCGGA
jgi:hypothetical protein